MVVPSVPNELYCHCLVNNALATSSLTDITERFRSHDITWHHHTSHDIHDYHMTITWHYMTSHDITWHCMTITWHYMTSHDITTHHMTITIHHMTSHDLPHYIGTLEAIKYWMQQRHWNKGCSPPPSLPRNTGSPLQSQAKKIDSPYRQYCDHLTSTKTFYGLPYNITTATQNMASSTWQWPTELSPCQALQCL